MSRWQVLASASLLLLLVWLGATALAEGRENARLLAATRRDAATIRLLQDELAGLRGEVAGVRAIADQLSAQVVGLGGTPVVEVTLVDPPSRETTTATTHNSREEPKATVPTTTTSPATTTTAATTTTTAPTCLVGLPAPVCPTRSGR